MTLSTDGWTMRWFGPTWHSPINDDCPETSIPGPDSRIKNPNQQAWALHAIGESFLQTGNPRKASEIFAKLLSSLDAESS